MQKESNSHLFWECWHVQELWSQIQNFLLSNNLEIKFNYFRICFGIKPKLVISSRKLFRIKVTPDLLLTYCKNGGNLGLVLKMKNKACISIVLTKQVKYTYLYLFKFVLHSIAAFKAN